jgi:hypothetical protein
LVDNRVLSARFRDKFVAELTKLHRSGQLKLTAEWSDLQDPAAFATWLKPLTDCDWVVFTLVVAANCWQRSNRPPPSRKPRRRSPRASPNGRVAVRVAKPR